MSESGGRAAGRPMRQVELYLLHTMAGPDRIDGHPNLHAKPTRERQHIPQRCAAQGALSGDRRSRVQATAAADRPARERDRQAEPAADASGEHGNGNVRSPVAHGIHERPQPRGGLTEVAVAEHEDRLARAGALALQSGASGGRHRLPLADDPLAAHHRRTGSARDLGSSIDRTIVGQEQIRRGERLRECRERYADPIGLVEGRDDDGNGVARGWVGTGGYCLRKYGDETFDVRSRRCGWLRCRLISRALSGR